MSNLSTLTPSDRINRRQAAEYLGVSINTLTCWASERKGPAFYKPGKQCMYKIADLDQFLESRRISFEQVPL
ncbi:hypothetical protein CAP48_12430 [Advenella sp. S44]|uniref:helix-turn-helix domain-containing protein n=1 Tax=Advenella sp. S44 TaxID=1982755 RepID=UPI000C2A09C0|nr:helix-turn-helix domain-containing protein [Advenella sp. S44]PJX23351.1 hypothetical protein CAP48_12430 [Advenella sp. S44]